MPLQLHLIHGLDCVLLLRYNMLGQVDLAEGAFAYPLRETIIGDSVLGLLLDALRAT